MCIRDSCCLVRGLVDTAEAEAPVTEQALAEELGVPQAVEAFLQGYKTKHREDDELLALVISY